MNIKIRDDIGKKLQERVTTGKEFKDVETYVNYILEQVIQKMAAKPANLAKSDEEKVKERLRGLGYLD